MSTTFSVPCKNAEIQLLLLLKMVMAGLCLAFAVYAPIALVSPIAIAMEN